MEHPLLQDQVSWCPSDNVVFAETGDAMALLDTATNVYYALSGIGPFLWNRLTEGDDFAALCAATVEAFEIDHASASRDIEEWLQQLAAAGLVMQRGG